jgi:dTDP-4-amino-4,6-dideoxygalactose transaminase
MNGIKKNWQEFAIFGAAPTLDAPLPVGQLYFPSWQRYEAAFRDIFEREYYTNQGPLVQQLELRLAETLKVRHVVCVTNATIGLIMAIEALGIKGKVIVPAFTFIASAQALTWAGLEPVFCDIDPRSHQITPELVEPLIGDGVSAILAVNLWGDSCDPRAFEALAKRRGLRLLFDSAHSVGCHVGGVPVGNFGDMEVFSFHATKVFGTAEGGCISTNDDALAATLRNIRSSYGAGAPVEVVKTSNGRMSEAQAAVGLMNLDELPLSLDRNRAIFERYRAALSDTIGARMFRPKAVSQSNHQYVVCEIDEDAFGISRDQLLRVLKAENVVARRYFYPGIHRSVPYATQYPQYVDALPQTDRLNSRLIQFPTGALVTDTDIDAVCALVMSAQRHANSIRAGWKD